MGEIASPVPLLFSHNTFDFDCGDFGMNEWLQKHGMRNEGIHSRTYVVCAGATVIGFYSLSTSQIFRRQIRGKFTRNAPETIPAMLLGRLAVDHRYQNRGIAKGLIKDALIRVCQISQQVGVALMHVHALSDEVKALYTKFGFRCYHRDDPLSLIISVKEIESHLTGEVKEAS